MPHHTSSHRSCATIVDRVVTGVLMILQCAAWAILMLPTPSAFDPASGGAVLVGIAAVAIGGPIVIVVTAALVFWAYYRDRTTWVIAMSGLLLQIVLYIFPIMVVVAMRT